MSKCNVVEVSESIDSGENSTEILREDEFSTEVMRFEPGDEDEMHDHEEQEVYLVNQGSAELNVEGDVHEVSDGDLIHVEPGQEHAFQNFEEPLVVTVFYAPPHH